MPPALYNATYCISVYLLFLFFFFFFKQYTCLQQYLTILPSFKLSLPFSLFSVLPL